MVMLKKKQRRSLDLTSGWLLVVGGLVHGGLAFDYNIVEELIAPLASWLPMVVYGLVGLSAVWVVIRNSKFMK
ncbi:MAG: DUF378 domain-containing protein [Bacillota bacterium]